MKNHNDELDLKVGQSRALAIAGISKSLIPLIFKDVDSKGEPLAKAFRSQSLPRTAAVISKFSGLLIQAYWYLLRTTGRQDEIPRELNNTLMQIWAGRQNYTQGWAISILQEASAARNRNGMEGLVFHPETFVKWKNLLLQREGRYKGLLNEFKLDDWHYGFSRLIDSLPILGMVEFETDKFVFPWPGPENHIPVPSSLFVHRSAQIKNPLYLYSFENVSSVPAVIFEDPYSNYTEELVIAESAIAEQYHLTRHLLGFKEVRQGILQLFGNSYDHIKQLALAIANTPGEALDECIEKWGAKEEYKEVAQRENREDFITLLIAGEGPTKVLKELLEHSKGLLDSYLDYFEGRGIDTKEYWKTEFRKQITAKKKPVESFLALDKAIKDEVLKEFDLEARIWCVIKASGLNIEPPNEYVESMGVRLKMLDNIANDYRNSQFDAVSAGVHLAHLFERTLRFLVCFYAGLSGYYRACENHSNDYYRCEEAMVSEARKAFRKIDKATAGPLIRYFRDTCANPSIKHIVERLLGRNQVCDLGKFDQILNVIGDADEWTKKLNRLKHGGGPKITQGEIITFVDQTRSLFTFLRDGKELSGTAALFGGEPIYPSIISFREQHRKRDGLIIYNYKVRSLDGNELRESSSVKILTPHDYGANESYYCIPFSKKSTNEWLLDPFLVRCSAIDAVFRQEA